MLNYYELLDLINTDEMTDNDYTLLTALRESFNNDFVDNLKTIKTTPSSVKQGITAFMKICKFKDAKNPGLYVTDCQVLSLSAACKDDNGVKTADLTKTIETLLSANKKPCDIYLKESIAVAKSLGYKYGDNDFMVEVDGNFYAVDRLYEIFRCLGNDCQYCQLLTSDYYKQGRQPLLLSGKDSFGVILPVIRNNLPKKYDCTFKHYVENEKSLDKIDLLKIRKMA